MMITSRPSKNHLRDAPGTVEIGAIKIIKPITKAILDQLDGRPKAYFYAIAVMGDVKIYAEMKPLEEW